MKKTIALFLIACAFTSSNNAFGMLLKQKSTCLQRHTRKLCTTSNNIKEIFNTDNSYKHSSALLLYHRNADIIKILNKDVDILRKQQNLACDAMIFPFEDITAEIYQLERELRKSFDIKKVE